MINVKRNLEFKIGQYRTNLQIKRGQILRKWQI